MSLTVALGVGCGILVGAIAHEVVHAVVALGAGARVRVDWRQLVVIYQGELSVGAHRVIGLSPAAAGLVGLVAVALVAPAGAVLGFAVAACCTMGAVTSGDDLSVAAVGPEGGPGADGGEPLS